MMQGNHKQAHWRGFVTRTGAVAGAGISSKDLAPQQLGFFPVLPVGGDQRSVTAINPATVPAFRIAVGKVKPEASKAPHGGVPYEPIITDLIYPKDIIGYSVTRAKKLNGGSRGEIWMVGYDGVDANKTLESGLDWHEKIIRVQMRGGPIKKAYGTDKEEVEIILDKGCIPYDCTDKKIAANYLADNFIKKWNNLNYLGGIKAKNFVKVTKLRLTNPAQTAKSVACNQYILTIPCDEGDGRSLGRVASQYPGYKVEIKSHSESTKETVYTMWRTVAQGAPAAVSLTDVAVPGCSGTCPAGYTSVAAAKVFQVSIGNGATVASLTGEISRTKVSSTPFQDVYLILTATSTALATAVTNVGTTGNPIVLEVGTQRAICNLTTPLSYAWTLCKTAYKGSKDWRITLQDIVCDACTNGYSNRLAELQARYPDLVIAIETDGNCITTYTTTTYSDCTQEECGEEAIFDIEGPVPFDRFLNWEEKTGALVTTPDCTTEEEEAAEICEAVGLKFETAVYNKLTTEHTYGHFMWDEADVDPVMINITIHSHDYTRPLCEKETKMLVKKTQEIAYERGQGSAVRELEYRWFNYYETLIPYESDPVIRDLYGMTAIARSDEYYDEVSLIIQNKTGGENIAFFNHQPYQVCYRMFFREGTASSVVNFLNAIVAGLPSIGAANPLVKPVVY